MVALHPEFVIDESKNPKAVLLPFSEWKEVIADLEELDDIRAFDSAKVSSEESIPFDQAVREIREDYKS